MLSDRSISSVLGSRRLGFLLTGASLLAGCAAARPPRAKVYRCEVVNAFPHDTNAFTQGLAYCDGELYEGTGLHGGSSIRRVELATGTVLQRCDLPWRYFGEGITLWGDKLIQLTWTSRTGFLYDRRSFRLLSTCSYPTKGWGLTHDDTRLIMSDGSATLYFREPDTFVETGRIRVTNGGVPVSNLNELELIRGEIWANVWRRYAIARISPASGEVLSWIDISGLVSPLDRLLAGSPNGIAYDVTNDRIFVTGKRWSKVFEIRVSREVHDMPATSQSATSKPGRAGPTPGSSEPNRR
jgi:glutamine cyclotransferase